jgi:hypothetical protein
MSAAVESRITRAFTFLGGAFLLAGWLSGQGHLAGFDTNLAGGWLLFCAFVMSCLPLGLPRWEVLLSCFGLIASWLILCSVGLIDVHPGQPQVLYSAECMDSVQLTDPGTYKITPDGCSAVRIW